MQDVASVHSIYAGTTEKAKYRLKKSEKNFEQRPELGMGWSPCLESRDGNCASSGRGHCDSVVS